jgi:protein TonB
MTAPPVIAAPRPRPAPAPVVRIPLPPAQPALPPPAAPARPHAAAPPTLRFPAPMTFSLGGAHPAPTSRAPARQAPRQQARSAPARHSGRGIDLSFAPNGGGSTRLSINGLLDRDGVGPDWANAFSAWVAQHSYYPNEAGILGEQGDVVVEFVVAKDGQVSGLHLVSSSGHPLLDMSVLGMLRGARLPPLPPQSGARLPVRFTMRYLIRP